MRTNLNSAIKSKPEPKIPVPVWIGGTAFRTLFLIILTVLTARVASPQIENIWSVFETPGDLIRVALGLVVCLWLVANLFILPKDPGAYRTWLYLGVTVLPLCLLCAFVVW
jgi:membrane protein YdbS with pleckstrin-like domain